MDETACIQCSVCSTWDHFQCSGLTVKEFKNDRLYFCKPPCAMFVLPFSTVKTPDLIENEILVRNDSVKLKPKKKKIRLEKRQEIIADKTKSAKSVVFDHFLDIN